tara:strand:- start:267 stop:524 length:258 start_codon:yes stop_codon:yes gene_type:complete
MVDIKKLTVSTDDQRQQWIDMLDSVVAYHWDMSGQFDPEIKTPNKDSDMEKVAAIHRAWARAITDAIQLIQMWEVGDESSIDGDD